MNGSNNENADVIADRMVLMMEFPKVQRSGFQKVQMMVSTMV